MVYQNPYAKDWLLSKSILQSKGDKSDLNDLDDFVLLVSKVANLPTD